MTLHHDMHIVAQNILQSYNAREETLGALRANVRKDLNNCRAVHQDMSAEQRQKLNEYMLGLRGQVADSLKEFDRVHQDMSAEQRQKLNEYMLGLRGQVGS